MSTEQRVQGMSGKVYLYNSRPVKVLQTYFEDGEIIVATDRGIIRSPEKDADKFLDRFLPMENTALVTALIHKKHLTSMTETLIDSIEKIKADKEYIPQAEAIGRQIGTLINIARLSIMMTKNDLI